MKKLELFYPVKTYFVGQMFGEDKACYDPITKKVIARTDLTCPAGFVSLYQNFGMKGHTGEDLMASDGQSVYCSQDGIVEEVETETARGLGLGIITDEKYDLGEYGEHYVKTRYWHLKGFTVNKGDQVKVGQIIGYADNTGFSAGDHLHFECKPIERNADGTYYNVYQSNGYYGAISPEPYWNKYYSQDTWIFYKMVEIYQQIINLLTKK